MTTDANVPYAAPGSLRLQIRQICGKAPDADLLLCHVLECSREQLYAMTELRLESREYQRLMRLARRRSRGEPLAYLTERMEFHDLEFQVSPDVLIPRPETELLVETTLPVLAERPASRILELGTGCGVVAISLANGRPHCNVLATDVSEAALAMARRNAIRHRAANIRFLISDWYHALPGRRFDVIVSNPPYVGADDPDLDPQVARYEPPLSLFAGENGKACLREIIRSAPRHLSAGGHVVLEHGWKQANAVERLMREAGLEYLGRRKDHQGHERVSAARFMGPGTL